VHGSQLRSALSQAAELDAMRGAEVRAERYFFRRVCAPPLSARGSRNRSTTGFSLPPRLCHAPARAQLADTNFFDGPIAILDGLSPREQTADGRWLHIDAAVASAKSRLSLQMLTC
jgi:hypothetical protein